MLIGIINMNARQIRFCEEYMKDLNATKAAKRSGYSKKTAHSIGPRLLEDVDIKKYISNLKRKRSDKAEITAERVLREIAKMAFSNLGDYITIQKDGTAEIDLRKLTRNQAAALSEVTVDDDSLGGQKVKIKLHDKLKGLEQLGRHLKLFTDKTELDGEVTFKGIDINFVKAPDKT